MTITQALSAPFVAIVGATGSQGGSVIKELAGSGKIGVEVVGVSLVVENRAQVLGIFSGADVAFVSLFVVFISISAAVGNDYIQSVTEASGGKYSRVYHWDSKATISEYGRASGVLFVDVHCGFYGSNFLNMNAMLSKQEDGSFTIPRPARPSTVLPFIDTAYDCGLWVRQVLEQPVSPMGPRSVQTAKISPSRTWRCSFPK
ncbi:NmrA-domain-containing protein [Mycena vulgaris]|nr:NmrA-domain-containing protein [Mycena vulgaris]